MWPVKENQGRLRQDIDTLFQPEQCVNGFSLAVNGFRTAETVEKGHGRIERRAITVSSVPKRYWRRPCADQVFKLERHSGQVRDGKVAHDAGQGVTSLTAEQAGPQRLLELSR